MKQILLTGIMFLILGMAYGQDKEGRNEKKEAIKAKKIAFLTTAMELTSDESQNFWPIYNQFEAEVKTLRKSSKTNFRKMNIDEISDKEIEEMMVAHMEIKRQELDLEEKYLKEYKKVISIKQIAKMHQAEKRFQIEVVKHFDKRREETGGMRERPRR
nr:hypothetical protein [uncultured bacterium]